MTFTINARKARRELSKLIDSLGKEKYVVITRYDRPKTVLVDFEYFSPRMTMTQEEWDAGFERMKAIINSTKGGMTEQEAYDFVNEVRREVRLANKQRKQVQADSQDSSKKCGKKKNTKSKPKARSRRAGKQDKSSASQVKAIEK